MDPIVTSMTTDDWETVRRIYEEGIATGEASFETDTPVCPSHWCSRPIPV